MRITSNIVSTLGRATDVTDRDVVSHLELLQQATFPLPNIAEAPPEFPAAGAGNLVRSSFMLEFFNSLTAGAAIQTDLIFVGRGLWRFQFTVQYHSNYLSLGAATGFELTFMRNVVKQSSIIELFPTNTPSVVVQEQLEMLLLDDTTGFAAILRGNIAAQTHAYTITIQGLKYL